jgi:hypothetical protein
VTRGINDARWLRERFAETKSLSDVVRLQATRWKESEERCHQGVTTARHPAGQEEKEEHNNKKRSHNDDLLILLGRL